MKYDLQDEFDIKRLENRIRLLINKKSFVELIDISKRSLKQNNYLHLIITAFAIETGYTAECVKINFYKLECNEDIFMVKSSGSLGTEYYLKSTADLTTEEMTTSIERFRNWASTQGYYLPAPNEHKILKQIEVMQSKLKPYL